MKKNENVKMEENITPEKPTEKSEADIKGLNEKIADLEKQLDDEKNSKLLAMADFQNYKKRLENDKNDYRVFATKMIVMQLMQIIDDFERAMADVKQKLEKQDALLAPVVSSLKMIQDKMSLVLTENGFEEIKIEVGNKFDPHTMEALSKLKPDKEHKEDTVIFVDQKGYKHIESGIVIKSAKVIIAKN